MVGRNDVHFGFSEVGMDILVLGVGDDDDGMSHGIMLSFIDPRVQGGHIHVLFIVATP